MTADDGFNRPMIREPRELTWRERRFAQLMAEGGRKQSQAYLEAGYTWRGSKQGLSSKACELAKKPHVAAEIARLRGLIDAAFIGAAAARRASPEAKTGKSARIPLSYPSNARGRKRKATVIQLDTRRR